MKFILCFLKVLSICVLANAAGIPSPAIKNGAKLGNERSNDILKSGITDHQTAVVSSAPAPFQSKPYEKIVITSVPDCYEFQEETQEERIERTMCELDSQIHTLKKPEGIHVDPAWLHLNSLNPMSQEPIHCQNIAYIQAKRDICGFIDVNYEHYERAIQEIVWRYLQMGSEFIENLEVDRFYYELEHGYGLPTTGVEREVIYLMLDVIYDYTFQNVRDNYNPTNFVDTENHAELPLQKDGVDGSYDYYYYYYADDV